MRWGTIWQRIHGDCNWEVQSCRRGRDELRQVLEPGPTASHWGPTAFHCKVGDLLELYCKACEEGNVTRQDWCLPKPRLSTLRDLGSAILAKCVNLSPWLDFNLQIGFGFQSCLGLKTVTSIPCLSPNLDVLMWVFRYTGFLLSTVSGFASQLLYLHAHVHNSH